MSKFFRFLNIHSIFYAIIMYTRLVLFLALGITLCNARQCDIFGQRVDPGQRAKYSYFVYECEENGGFHAVGCLDKPENGGTGAEHSFGDRWVEGKERPYKYVFECKKVGDGPRREIVQCFYDSDDGQAKIDVGSEQVVGKNRVRCVRSSSGLGANYDLTPVGDGRSNSGSSSGTSGSSSGTSGSSSGTSGSSSGNSNSNSGDSGSSGINSNSAAVVSNIAISSNSGDTRVVSSGQTFTGPCNINGQQVARGQRAKSGNFVYECRISGGYGIVACLDNPNNGGTGSEHAIGERWVEGKDRPFKYVFECSRDGEGGAKRQIVQCFYDSDEGQAKIDVDTEQVVGKTRVRCVKSSLGAYYDRSPAGDSNRRSSVSGGSNSDNGQITASLDSRRQCDIFGNVVSFGQRARARGFIYECKENGGFSMVGCIGNIDNSQNGDEYPFGGRWTYGNNRPYKYVFECTKDGSGGVKKVAQCFYDSDDGRVKIDVGSESVVGKYRVRCVKSGDTGAAFDQVLN